MGKPNHAPHDGQSKGRRTFLRSLAIAGAGIASLGAFTVKSCLKASAATPPQPAPGIGSQATSKCAALFQEWQLAAEVYAKTAKAYLDAEEAFGGVSNEAHKAEQASIVAFKRYDAAMNALMQAPTKDFHDIALKAFAIAIDDNDGTDMGIWSCSAGGFITPGLAAIRSDMARLSPFGADLLSGGRAL